MVLKYDFSKLKGRIIEKFDSYSAFSEFLGKNPSHVSNFLSGRQKFSQKRIQEWCEALDIPQEEIVFYFFTIKVDS